MLVILQVCLALLVKIELNLVKVVCFSCFTKFLRKLPLISGLHSQLIFNPFNYEIFFITLVVFV